MAKKVYIQPGVWVILIVLGMVGAYFGITAMQKNGSWSKVTSAVAPTGNQGSGVKIKNIGGKKPLVVAVNTWCGFAPGVYFNGGLAASESSRFVTEYGTPVQIVIMDNFDDSRNAWKAGKVDIICNTADVLPIEAPSMASFGLKVFMQLDWSDGGDKFIARPGIMSISDLKGKTVAIAPGTPSQTLLLKALEAGDLSYSDIIIKSMATAMDAAAAFKSGDVDAAVVWSPDDEDCLQAIPGSKVMISTEEANQCIADVFYAKEEFIQSHQKEMKAFTSGWLKASRELNKDRAARMEAQKLMATVFNVPEAVMNLDNAYFTTYGDNVNFFNISPTGTGVTGEELYSKMSRAFSKIGLITGTVPAWRSITDINILQSIAEDFKDPADAAKGVATFTAPVKAMETVQAIATKRLTINFASGASALTEDAKYTIDKEFAGIAKSMAGYRIRVEGNTDNVGSVSANRALSLKRAQSVKTYLVQTYSFDPNRFIIVGNGPDSPVADNNTEEGKAQNRRTDFELIQ